MKTNGSEKAKMMSTYRFILFILLVLLLGACTSQTTTPSPPPPTAMQMPEPTPSPTAVPTLVSLPDVGVISNWTPVEMNDSYSRFVHTDPVLELHVVRVETDDPQIGVDTALGQIGVDISALSLLGAIPDPRWSIYQLCAREWARPLPGCLGI